MKHLFLLLMVAAGAAMVCQSCLTQAERFLKKQEKAKRKIDRLVKKYPDLRTIKDTTIISYDTIINNDTIIYNDTIITKQEVMDSSFYFSWDSIYRVQQGSIEALFQISKDKKIEYKIIKQPEYIHVHDTLYHRDTIVNTNTVYKEREIINTTKNFWFSLWLSIKGWIWWVLVIIALLLILRMLYKILKN